MDMAADIRRMLTAQQVAEFYGFQVGRSGFMKCPFHQGDHTASLKLYDGEGGFHCFGCGAHGSVIDFVMRLFDLNFRQAVLRINADFHLGLTNQRTSRSILSEAARRARQKRREEEKREQEWWETIRLLWYYREATELAQPVRTENSVWIHPIYAEAVKALPEIEYWLDERFQEGDGSHWNKSQNSAKMTS